MRCPKCGSFLGDGINVCFMCGTNVKTYNPGANQGGTYFNQGMGMQQGGFSQQGKPGNAFDGLNDYDKIYNSVKKGDKDVFDFFADHKALISFISFLGIIFIICITGLIYYKVKNKETPLKPVVGQLYYNVHSSLQNFGDGSYGRSGDKGNDCAIAVRTSGTIDDDHVETLFTSIKQQMDETIDKNNRDSKTLKIIDAKEVYTVQEGDIKINGQTWYFMNVYYPAKANETPTIMKRRILTTIKNSYTYDIETINSSNDSSCSATIDEFMKSLQFLEETAESK